MPRPLPHLRRLPAPPPPLTAPLTAPLAALLALAWLAAGCAAEEVRCPGRAEGTFTLQATRTGVGCAAGAPADGFDVLYPPSITFDATISFAAEGTAAAICTLRRSAVPLTGTHLGDQVTVSLETSGAVLGACSATCAVTVRQEIAGTLGRDAGSGLATGFTGTLVDRATAAGADCSPCTPPCSATYVLAPAQP